MGLMGRGGEGGGEGRGCDAVRGGGAGRGAADRGEARQRRGPRGGAGRRRRGARGGFRVGWGGSKARRVVAER